MFHTLLFVFGSMAVGYIVYTIIYWRIMHALVPIQYGNLSAVDLLKVLAVVGLFLSFL